MFSDGHSFDCGIGASAGLVGSIYRGTTVDLADPRVGRIPSAGGDRRAGAGKANLFDDHMFSDGHSSDYNFRDEVHVLNGYCVFSRYRLLRLCRLGMAGPPDRVSGLRGAPR